MRICCEDCMFDCSYHERQEDQECFLYFDEDLEDLWFVFVWSEMIDKDSEIID